MIPEKTETENYSSPTPAKYADILAIGFGTTVAMWTVGYLCRLPPALVPSKVLLFFMLACLVIGGFVSGRYTNRGLADWVVIAVLSSVLNLLIIGSLLGGENPNQIIPSALWWIPGSIIISICLVVVGALVGSRFPHPQKTSMNWTNKFSIVAAVATFLLLFIGGIVTSYEAGLAVVDWPNSFGYNMFLYPLSRMTGGVYYEHAHRLMGSLVGLTTLVLAIHIQFTDSRKWLRQLTWLALILVIVQGILGGLRVTGYFTLSTVETEPNITLAIAHGVIGQVFFGMIIALSVFTSSTWINSGEPLKRKSVSTDRVLLIALIVLLIIQLLLGAILRHISNFLLIHISMAVIVTAMTVTCGVRAWGLYEGVTIIQRLGLTLMAFIGIQIILGIGALAVTGDEMISSPTPLQVFVATAHQAVGALLLAFSVMLLLWTHCLLTPQE